jgi:hypothetical protein
MNILVVISSWLYLILPFGTNFHIVVTVIRVFRPFYLIQVSKSLLKIFISLLKTIPSLSKIFSSLFFIMIFYGILGLHIFMGAFDYRCRIGTEP